MKVHVVQHPLIAHWLTVLRDRDTPPPVFRQALHRVTTLVLYEATRKLSIHSRSVTTPLETTTGAEVVERVALVPILRAGLGMVEPALQLLPQASVWHLGFYRDETTLQPVEYYDPFASRPRQADVAYILDPMLATGGSARAAAAKLLAWGVPRVIFVGLIAAPEGLEHLHQHCPQVPVYVAAVDRQLNERGFILPGLGDAGDRQFGTGG